MSDDIVEKARKLFKADQEYWSPIYDKSKADLHFLSDDVYAQWDERDYENRISSGRPALTVDQLGQFIHQVSNNIRMNTPAINPIPVGGGADVETAEVIKGLIKAIEYDSGADEVYDTAVDFAIRCGIGFLRVDHDYADDQSFDQKLIIKRVINPFAIFLDRDSIESDGRDARHATVIEKISVAQFKEKYPDKEPCCFDIGSQTRELKDSDYIYIAEFFILQETTLDIMLTEDGTVAKYQDGVDFKLKRSIKKTTVKRYKLSGCDELEATEFPGRYIPIVPVYGEEQWIDGKRNLLSLIRKSKDAQRMFNVWKSLETEVIMKQPVAPIMVAEGAVEDYAADWKNPSKAMVLRYKHVDADGNPIPAPQRLAPPSIPSGVVNASRETIDDIKATMGIYNASLGAKSNETSGVAINQRKIEGDVATFHFGDNLVRSIAQCGRVCVFAIPETYDGSRILQIISDEYDAPKPVGVNGAVAENQEQSFDLTQGVYQIRVITGASFTTKRQETVNALNTLFQANPQLMTVFGDIFFRNSDFSGAEALAKRAEKLVPPELKDDAPQQDPAVMALQQQLQQAQQIIQQGAMEMQQLQQELKSKDQTNMVKAQGDQQKAQIEAEKAALDAHLRSRELNIQETKVAGDLAIASQQMQINTLMEAMSRIEQSMAQENTEANSGSVQQGEPQ